MDAIRPTYLHVHLGRSSLEVELPEKRRSADVCMTEDTGAARELLEQIQAEREVLHRLINKVCKTRADTYDAFGGLLTASAESDSNTTIVPALMHLTQQGSL
jgi:hypothetical protein